MKLLKTLFKAFIILQFVMFALAAVSMMLAMTVTTGL